MSTTTLALPFDTPLQATEAWARLAPDNRKRQCVKLILAHDHDGLLALLSAHTRHSGRRGLHTAQNTLDSYHAGATTLLTWCHRNARLPHQLTPDDARRWIRGLEASGLKPSSVQTRLSGGRRLLAALTWALGQANCALDQIHVHDPIAAADKRRPYTADELHRILDVCHTRHVVLVLLAADAGLRASEALAVTWQDVDLTTRTLRITDGKGGSSGTVRLTPRLAAALAALRDGIPPIGPHVGLLSLRDRRQLHKIITRLCKHAHVTPRGYHALRHTAGTRLYAATRDLVLVQKHLRHRCVETTTVYAQLADQRYAAGVDMLDD